MTIKSIVTTSLICSAVALATVGSALAQWYNQGGLQPVPTGVNRDSQSAPEAR